MNKDIISKKKTKRWKMQENPKQKSQLKNTIPALKNPIEGLISRWDFYLEACRRNPLSHLLTLLAGLSSMLLSTYCTFPGTVSQGSLVASRDHPHSLALSPPPAASKAATMGCVFVTFQIYLTISSASSVCAHSLTLRPSSCAFKASCDCIDLTGIIQDNLPFLRSMDQ